MPKPPGRPHRRQIPVDKLPAFRYPTFDLVLTKDWTEMKTAILNILRRSGDRVSGEQLSAELGVSRVSIWKHIRALQAAGHPIEATSKGYRLGDEGDVLSAYAIPGREGTIHYYPEVPSTMGIARDLAREGCPHLTAVVAGRQLQGRGRLDRSWASADGGLYFTVVVRPHLPVLAAFRVNFRASATLAHVLRDQFEVPASVKWPNDILVGERKLAGLLSEMETRGELVSFINIGIGINVNNDPGPEAPDAVSIRELLGRPVPRRRLLAGFLDAFEARLEADPSLSGAIEDWKARTVTIGRSVRVVTTTGVSEGTAEDVDETGALILRRPDGTAETVIYGDCFHGPDDNPTSEHP